MIDRLLTLSGLAEAVGGTLEGDARKTVRAVAAPESAGPEDAAVVKKLAAPEMLAACNAGCLVVPEGQTVPAGRDVIRVKDTELAFIAVLGCFASPDDFPLTDAEGVSKDAVISNGAVLAASASVGSGSRIGENSVLSAGVRVGREVRIGSGCRFYPNVVIHDGSVIGDRVTVKSNSVIGGCGFGYHRVADRHIPIPQIGNVVIGDDVDIGSCVCVDRGTIGSTRIGRNVKIDNLVQIAHNVVIGENAIVISQVGISGSVTVGKDAILAGQAGIADHIVIEDGAIVGAKAGVLGRVKTGEMVLGIPARPIMAFKRSVIYMEKLGDLFKRVAAIEKKSQEEPHG